MKKVLVSICCVFLVLAMLGAYSETIQYGMSPVRTGVTADDTPLAAATFATRSASAVEVPVSANNCQVLFYGTDAADEACDYILYAYRSSGPAIEVCSGTVTLGTAQNGAATTLFADTITATDVWATTVTVSDSGNNGVCTLSFDLIGYKYIFCEVLPTSGTCTSISAEISYF